MPKLTFKQLKAAGKWPAPVLDHVEHVLEKHHLRFVALVERDSVGADEGERLTFYGRDANGQMIVKTIQAPTNEGGPYHKDISYYLLSQTISMKQYGVDIVVSERLFLGKWFCTVQVQEGTL